MDRDPAQPLSCSPQRSQLRQPALQISRQAPIYLIYCSSCLLYKKKSEKDVPVNQEQIKCCFAGYRGIHTLSKNYERVRFLHVLQFSIQEIL